MRINFTKERTDPVTILHLDGTLDGSNFNDLLDEVQKIHKSGCRNLILDLEKLTFISSAGLSAIHQAALLFRGNKSEEGSDESWYAYRWAAFHDNPGSLKHHPPHAHVKLLSPTREVKVVLDTIGFSSLFEIHTDLNQAMASFRQRTPVMETNPG
jgi:anti-anti-sigma factor